MRNEVVGTDDQRRRRQLAALVGMMAVIVLLVFALTLLRVTSIGRMAEKRKVREEEKGKKRGKREACKIKFSMPCM